MSALEIAQAAIAAIDLEARVRESLREVSWNAPARVVAVGKAAPAMTRGALSVAPDDVHAVVVTADGTDARGLDRDPRVRLLRAAHPIPDPRSVLAAEALLTEAQGARTCVALISGGASALACAPADGLSLADKQALVAALLDAGAPITDVNVVRRHLSRIKGGGLVRAAAAARGSVLTRIVSDVLVESPGGEVVAGAPHDIGSGPASLDPTTVEDARAALARWVPDWLPRVTNLLVDTMPNLRRMGGIDERIVASPLDLVAAAAAAARTRGLGVEIAPPSLAPVDELAAWYVARASTLAPGSVVVRVAEPSVALPPVRGRGGRAGRLALGAWAGGLPDDVELACLSSDGVDGSSGAAGAVVSGALTGSALARAHDALARFDDAAFLSSAGRAVVGAPSGSNLLDLHVLARVR